MQSNDGDLCVHLSANEASATSRAARSRLRRVFLVGAAISPLFAILDFFNVHEHRSAALALRLLWGASTLAVGLAIPRASERGLRVLLALTAAICVILLSLLTVLAGGTTGQYFQYLVAMPMCVAVCLPVEVLAAVVASVAALACGVGLMLLEGRTPAPVMLRWAMLCTMSGGLAVFACRTYRGLRDAERRASLAREVDLRRLAAVVAHEINNQLAILQNTIAILGKHKADGSVLALQQDSVSQMRELTVDFLRYGEPVRGPKEAVDLLHLAYAYAKAFAPHVEVTSSSENAVVVGDRTGIARALLNVLKNGVEAGGPVQVVVGEKSDGVSVRVRDHGPGVPREVAARIGEPFYTTKTRGTGLGLALVKQVVVEHNGQFSIYNRDGGGVLAEIWLPRGQGSSA